MAITYVAAVPTYGTIRRILRFCKKSGIKASSFYKPHATIIHSNDLVDTFSLPDHEFPIVGENPKLVTFDTKDDGLCLVIKFDSDELSRMHYGLKYKYGLRTDYEYIPHITLKKNMDQAVTDPQVNLKLKFEKIFVKRSEKSA